MEKFIIFFVNKNGLKDFVIIDALDLKDASVTADAFSCKSGATIVGICPEYLLNSWHHE